MDKKLAKLLNDQINAEFYSAYLYMDFANFFTEKGLDGYANWYMVQTQEERDHAMLFRQYLHNEGEKVTFDAIAKPDVKMENYIDPMEAALEHEKYITSRINEIYAVANEVKDFRTMQFLDWFVKEQGEEEKNAADIVSQFKLFGSDPKGLFDLDRENAARVYNPPSLVL